MLHLLGVSAFVFYVLATVLFSRALALAQAHGSQRGARFFSVAVGLHTAVLVAVALRGPWPHLLGGTADSLLLVSWIMALSFFVFWPKLSSPVLGTFISLTVSVFFAGASVLLHAGPATGPASADLFLWCFHVAPAVAAEACVALAFVVSLVYLFRDKKLRTEPANALRTGAPNLQSLGTLNFRLLLSGFLLLSVAILSGIVRVIGVQGFALFRDQLTWISILSWIIIGVILHLRRRNTWSARKLSAATAWSAGGFILVLSITALFLGNVVHSGMP